MRAFLRNFRGALGRLNADVQTQAQAVAFNMFLAFFPVLLLALGVLSSSQRLAGAVEEMLRGLRSVLPPGSGRMVMDYLTERGPHPWKAILLGLGGTLFVGVQVLDGLLRGFALLQGDRHRPAFWRRQARGFALLLVTIVPWMLAVVLIVFGKQVRGWMIHHFGLPAVFQRLWLVVYLGLGLVMATLMLAVLYRVGQRGCRGWNEVLPGAVLATLLWWVVNTAFGFYVRRVPYSLVYGGLAAVIGLLVWMYLNAMVVLLGAAYNAAGTWTADSPIGADTGPPP